MLRDEHQTGLLLVGHGTRSQDGTRQFLSLAAHLAESFSPLIVEPAFLELQQPDIDASIGRLIERGISRLVTLPLLLFAAGHAKHDIPQQVAAALSCRGHSQIEQIQAPHLGCHPALVELSRRRMGQAADRQPIRARPLAVGSTSDLAPANLDTCLLLVGRGNRDESAIAEMHEFARLRQQDLGSARIKVEIAFLAMAQPLLREQLRNLACQGLRRVIVQPHLLFYGELVAFIERQVAEVVESGSKTDWMVTAPLADRAGFVTFATELIQKVIQDRCQQAGIHVVGPRGAD